MRQFAFLILHFVKRMFSGDGEEGGESMSAGVGLVFAVLASPGAFASLFLLDKYSTLLQFFRGQRGFNPYPASIADEYFFVVLSMTITGLVMVLRWNRLFPDRRDFWNLAVLPIPIGHVFLANFTALVSLALIFALDVNAVSSVLFPAFVTMSDGSFMAFFHIAAAHATAVLSASLFSFFAGFALVGVLMLVLPARWLRPASVVVRMLLVVVLLTEFSSNWFLQLMSGRLPGDAHAHQQLLPAFWFLGVYRKMAGLASAGIERPMLALAVAVGVAVAAYSLCYRRHFLRLAESLDTLGVSRRTARFPMPEWLGRLLFRSPFERAVSVFTLKVITRSERHVMLLGAYLGVGLVISANAGTRIAPLLVPFFLISGLRFVFDAPAALPANWIFRSAVIDSTPAPEAVARRLLLFAALPWQLVLLAPLGWRVAWPTAAINTLLIALAIEFLLLGYYRIAFTCCVETDTRQLVVRMAGILLTGSMLIPVLVEIERWTVKELWRFGFLVVLLLFLLRYAVHVRRARTPEERALRFEDRPAASFELLKLAP
jgi:hypothetical protein